MSKYDWDAIKAKVDILEVVLKVVPLKRSGNIYKGKCPIHNDNSPSFVVYDDGYHCFGCGAHGDAIDFIVAMEGCTKAEAIERLGANDFTLTGPEKRIIEERDRSRAEERKAATAMAAKRWEAAEPASEDHPYLDRKMVLPHMARIDGKAILLPVYDRDGEIMSVQSIDRDGGKLFQWGEYLKDADGNFVLDKNGKKMRGSGAPTKGGRLNFGICIGRTIVCEGFATGASIYEAIPDRVAVGFSKMGVIDLVRELHGNGQQVVIASDRNALPEMLALGKELGVPVYAPSDPHDDFNDMAVAMYEADATEGDVSKAVRAIFDGPSLTTGDGKDIISNDTPIAANDDSDPVDIWAKNAAPDLPRDVLPPIIERFAYQASELSGADAGGYVMAALAVCSMLITDRIRVKVKRSEEWSEAARMWVMLLGEPSYKKSPIMSLATKKMMSMDGSLVAEYEKASADYSKDDSGPPPIPKRYRVDDITMESAQEVARYNPDGILAVQDELGGWFGGIEKYSGGKGGAAKDRAFWLRAAGGGQYAVNRISRKPFLIENLSIGILGGIQPDSIRRVMSDATDDGLIQRFFPVVLRPATIGKDNMPNDAITEYNLLVEHLPQIAPPSNFFGEKPLVFDDGAQEIRNALEVKHHGLVQAMESVNKKMASHMGKYDAFFPRLCVLFHVIENANMAELPDTITEDTARRVDRFLSEYIMRHSMSFYTTTIGVSDDQDIIEDVAGYILAHGVDKVTLRTFHHGSGRMRKLTRQQVEPVCHQLEALGWLDKIDARATQFICTVNPRVHELFADRAVSEVSRRAEVKDKIRVVTGEKRKAR